MKRSNAFRLRRQKVFEKLFSARALCITGLIIMPALLFNPIPPFRVLQFLFFWFLCWLAGKKNRPLLTILVFVFIVAFNLIVPYGQVLFSIGKFRITFGALMTGIQRAVTLQGLIMLSRLAIRRDLHIPGKFGELLGESLKYYALIMSSRKRITRKNLVGDIDQMMLDLSEDRPLGAVPVETQEDTPAARTKAVGFVILAFVTLLSWLPMAFYLLVVIVSR
jgi:heptaprenyl diphosphate synthase